MDCWGFVVCSLHSATAVYTRSIMSCLLSRPNHVVQTDYSYYDSKAPVNFDLNIFTDFISCVAHVKSQGQPAAKSNILGEAGRKAAMIGSESAHKHGK